MDHRKFAVSFPYRSVEPSYPVPLHLQKPGHELGYGSGDLPVAESQADRLVTLPAHEYLSEPQVEMTMGVVEDALVGR